MKSKQSLLFPLARVNRRIRRTERQWGELGIRGKGQRTRFECVVSLELGCWYLVLIRGLVFPLLSELAATMRRDHSLPQRGALHRDARSGSPRVAPERYRGERCLDGRDSGTCRGRGRGSDCA